MPYAPLPIRRALPTDATALSALKVACFRETFVEDFAIPYPAADLAIFESEAYGEPQVTADLADPAHTHWLVESGGELLAYAHIGPCKLPHAEVRPGDIEFYQLYLRRHAQSKGLGKRLMDHVMAHLDQLGGPVWLGVWQGNLRAQALYHSRGFVVVGEYQFRVGSSRDEELILRRDPATPNTKLR